MGKKNSEKESMFMEEKRVPSNGRKAGCIKYKCLRTFVIICAIILAVIGLGIAGLGAWLTLVQVHYEDLRDLLFLPSVLMMALGALVLIVAVLKLVGACRHSTGTLWVVFILLILLIVAETVVAVLAFMSKQRGEALVQEHLRVGITKYNQNKELAEIVDRLQSKMGCCGIDSYNDWQYSVHYTCDRVKTGDGKACSVPDSCCLPDAARGEDGGCGREIRRRTYVEAEKVIYPEGCYVTLRSWLSRHLDLAGAVVMAFTAFEIFCVFTTYWLISHARRRHTMYSFKDRVLS